MEQPPATAGIVMANWYWKVVRQFVSERFGISLSRSSCLNWLHRLGFAFKRPKKRLLKADESKRETFVAEYAVLWEEAQRTEARIFFADEAHFRADAELRGKWVLKGKPALVDSSSPRYGEKASYYSAVCLETGEVEWMELEGNSNSGTSVAFLTQLPDATEGKASRAAAGHLCTTDLSIPLPTSLEMRKVQRRTGSTETPFHTNVVSSRTRLVDQRAAPGHNHRVRSVQSNILPVTGGCRT